MPSIRVFLSGRIFFPLKMRKMPKALITNGFSNKVNELTKYLRYERWATQPFLFSSRSYGGCRPASQTASWFPLCPWQGAGADKADAPRLPGHAQWYVGWQVTVTLL